MNAYLADFALYRAGRVEEARSRLEERYGEIGPSGSGVVLLAAGDTAGARERAARYEELDASFAAGLLHAALGNRGRAVEDFRAFLESDRTVFHGGQTIRLRYFFPQALASFREDPRYRDLIREYNRAWGLNPDGSFPDSVDISRSSCRYCG